MKKFPQYMVALALALSLFSASLVCAAPKSVTVDMTIVPQKEAPITFQAQIPFNPQRVVAIDFTAVDLLDALGLGDRIVAMPKDSAMPHLQKYIDNKNIANVGGMKDFDAEKIKALKPDLIFISGRLAAKYKEISAIAPTIINAVDYTIGAFNSIEKMGLRNASVFGKEAEFKEKFAPLKARLEAVQKASKGKTAMIINIVGAEAIVMGDGGRMSMVPRSFGFTNPATKEKTGRSTAKSLEAIAKHEPDYIFVLSKDMAVGAKGAVPAEQTMDSEILRGTKAFKNGRIAYVTPSIWYLAEGGIHGMSIMLDDAEKVLKN